ncbi:MAG TPA: circumsporozoite protein [Allosphingosinicella sp.]|nr:circumsporozoite protein [Allosphingosinicella sp.]
MKKIALTVAAIATLGLAACGGGETENTTTNTADYNDTADNATMDVNAAATDAQNAADAALDNAGAAIDNAGEAVENAADAVQSNNQ